MDIRELLIKHEGVRLKPYRDTVGKLTIGVGRNLDDVGITYDEALYILDNDIKYALESAQRELDWFDSLCHTRKIVILNMIFNLGLPRMLGFKKTIAAIKEEDYETAADEMLDSKWAKQVGNRAIELSDLMRLGYMI